MKMILKVDLDQKDFAAQLKATYEESATKEIFLEP